VVKAFSTVTWEEALRGFTLHKQASTSQTTAKWYGFYCTNLVDWSNEKNLSLSDFTKRHLDEFLVYRAGLGKAATTLHHDALCATVFTEWCKSNGLVERDPLAEYKVRNPPKTYKYMPTLEDVKRLLQGILDFYDLKKNPESRYLAAAKRSFHRDRNYAIEIIKLDTACRIGEVFAFKVSDYQKTEKGYELLIRESKGREAAVVPVSPDSVEAMHQWLKIRKRIMGKVPEGQDPGWLFLSESGTQVDPGNYLRCIKKVCVFVGLSSEINNHSQRRFSINAMANDPEGGLLFAQRMARHKDPKTTVIYTELNSDFLRDKHGNVGVIRGILNSKRTEKRKRLKL
jgi:site-specific recombinase XerD